MTNVIVAKINNNRTIDSSNPVVLKQATNLTATIQRLDHLQDVIANNEVQGATLVYDETNDQYVVKKLDLENVTGILDGGTF
jgi:NADH/NAD ratio-sensing transcriptional regulator Rex